MLDAELILADVHQLLRRLQLRAHATLEVRLSLTTLERLLTLKGGTEVRE